jgi:hypothetical protein
MQYLNQTANVIRLRMGGDLQVSRFYPVPLKVLNNSGIDIYRPEVNLAASGSPPSC